MDIFSNLDAEEESDDDDDDDDDNSDIDKDDVDTDDAFSAATTSSTSIPSATSKTTKRLLTPSVETRNGLKTPQTMVQVIQNKRSLLNNPVKFFKIFIFKSS